MQVQVVEYAAAIAVDNPLMRGNRRICRQPNDFFVLMYAVEKPSIASWGMI